MTREEKYLKVNNIIKDMENGMSREAACKKSNLKVELFDKELVIRLFLINMESIERVLIVD